MLGPGADRTRPPLGLSGLSLLASPIPNIISVGESRFGHIACATDLSLPLPLSLGFPKPAVSRCIA